MYLCAQECLTDFKVIRNRLCGHPDIYPETGHVTLPDILSKIERCQFSGKTELPADRLSDPLAVERLGHGIDNGVCDRPVILVSPVHGCYKIKPLLQNRTYQELYPLGRNGTQVGVDHAARLRAKLCCHLEDGPEGAPLAGYAVIRRCYPVHGVHPVGEEYGLVVDLRVKDFFRGGVFGAPVGIDDYGFLAGEIFHKAGVYRAHDMAYGPGVVVARYPDHNAGARGPCGGLHAFAAEFRVSHVPPWDKAAGSAGIALRGFNGIEDAG